MNTPNELPSLDALAAAVASRLAGQIPKGIPTGEPDPELPPGSLFPSGGTVPDFRVSAQVAIAGVEYTQSTQFNSVTTPWYGQDNSVPLVAYKTLVARVYPTVHRGVLGGDALTGTRVTGELTLSIGDRILYRADPTRSAGARLGATSKIDRTLWDRELTAFSSGGFGKVFDTRTIEINCPLNFIVPAYYCRVGRIYATVRLWPVADGPMTSRGAVATQYLQFLDVQAPKVCLVRVNWTDSSGNVNKPTDAQMLATTNLAERMLPFPYFETTILGIEVNSTAAFATVATAGGCNTAWSSLVASLNVTRIFTALFQLGDIVYGMVPAAAIPASAKTINSGCGKGAGGGFVGYNFVFPHELGHLYGRSHVAVSGDPTNDTSYPNYGGSKTSIGEIGIDMGTTPPTLYDPASNGDIMSYANTQWISPYTYQAILDARSTHQNAPIDPKRLRPIFVIIFRLNRSGLRADRVELKTVSHIQAAGLAPTVPADAVSPVSIDILDANQHVLATHHCMFIPAHAGGCGCHCGGGVPLDREPWLDFAEAVEWPGENAAAIAFHDGKETFHTIHLGEAPRVEIEGPSRLEKSLAVRVRTHHPRERVSVVLLFSADDGATWQPVAFDPPDGEVEFETDRLPGGERCRFRAIGTAELRSAEAETPTFELPRTPRRLIVDVPSDPCCTRAAGPVALRAFVDTRGLGAVAPQDLRWSSSLDGELGNGYSLSPYLSAGQHELTVTAPNGLGGTLSERAIIIVGG
jgi:hypothetical protein